MFTYSFRCRFEENWDHKLGVYVTSGVTTNTNDAVVKLSSKKAIDFI